MSWTLAARQHPKWVAKELAYRLRLRDYRPDSIANWDSVYRRESATDSLVVNRLEALAKYSLTIGYIRYFMPDADILDVGCGPASLRHYLPGDAFRSYVGIDHSPHAIELATATYSDDRTRFVLAEEIPADIGPFNAVALLDVLYHVPSPPAVLERVKAVTGPGAIVVTAHWRHPGEWMLLDLLDRSFERADMVFFDNPSGRNLSPLGTRMTCHIVR